MFFSDFARRPIDENSPSGSSPVGLDEFDEIKRQINNINKVTGRVSWKTVQTLSKKVLSSHSKDFRCSCYYTVAAIHNEGLRGLGDGLSSLLDLCVVYWYSAYPAQSKQNARIVSVEWMIEHIDKRLVKLTPNKDELNMIETIHRICLRIEEELRLHYGIKAPSFGRIRRTLQQWIEEIKDAIAREEALLEKQKAQPTQKAIIPVQPSISVDIKPPECNKVDAPIPATKPNRSGKIAILSVIALIAVALGSNFTYQHLKYTSLKNKVTHSSIPELQLVVNTLAHEKKEFSIELRNSVVNRLDTLLTDWTLDPTKIVQAKTTQQLTAQLEKLYPDSSSVKMLRNNFEDQLKQLDASYNTIHRQFSSARTVFANVNAHSTNKNTTKAYEYSNSLFPLLGRIEYAEKTDSREEIDRSLAILNSYLYKIVSIKSSEETTKQ